MAVATILRGLRDMKISAWTAENSYGTAYDIYGAREMGVELVLESDQLEGDDVVLSRYSKIIAVTFRFANAAVDLELLDILSGGTLVSNASYEDVKIGQDDNIPYVAMAGRIVSDGVRDVHIFVPKAKLSGNLQYQAAYAQYLIPQAEFQGVNEGTINGLARFRNFSAATGLEIPLRITTGGA